MVDYETKAPGVYIEEQQAAGPIVGVGTSTAALIGTVPAVVLGGVAAIVVAAVWMRWFRALYERDAIHAR